MKGGPVVPNLVISGWVEVGDVGDDPLGELCFFAEPVTGPLKGFGRKVEDSDIPVSFFDEVVDESAVSAANVDDPGCFREPEVMDEAEGGIGDVLGPA